MRNNIVYAIVAFAFVSGIFATAYAGPVLTTITLAGNVDILGDLTCTDCIDSTDIADGTIKGVDIGVGQIGGAEIGANGVGAGEIATDAVRADEIQAGAVGSSEIASGAVTNGKIAADTIQSGKINDGTIQGADIDSTTTITAAGYALNNPETRSIVISPAEFSSTNNHEWAVPTKGAAGFIASTSTGSFVFAQIPILPDGATITKLECRVQNQLGVGEPAGTCALIRQSFLIPGGETMAITSLSANPNPIVESDTTIINPLVDRDTFSYILRWSADPVCDNNCRLFSAKITYTIDKVD